MSASNFSWIHYNLGSGFQLRLIAGSYPWFWQIEQIPINLNDLGPSEMGCRKRSALSQQTPPFDEHYALFCVCFLSIPLYLLLCCYCGVLSGSWKHMAAFQPCGDIVPRLLTIFGLFKSRWNSWQIQLKSHILLWFSQFLEDMKWDCPFETINCTMLSLDWNGAL